MNGVYLIPLLLMLICVAVMDFQYRKVKNIIFGLSFFYVFLELFLGGSYKDIWLHLLAACLLFFLLLPIYVYGGMGAGDVKIGSVVGLFWGVSFNLLSVMVIALGFAFLHAIVFIFIRNQKILFEINDALPRVCVVASRKLSTLKMKNSIPFAAYLAIASIFWMLYESPP